MKKIALFAFLIFSLLAAPIAYAQRVPMPYAKIQFFDRSGNPLSGGRLWSYVAGTTTPTPTYPDATGAGANTNPVILDTAGRASVWLSGAVSYKLILEDSTCSYRDVYGSCHGVMIWTVDSITDYGAYLSAGGSIFTGDVTGAYDSTVVTKLQGFAVSDATPTSGQVLVYGSQWAPGAVSLTDTDAISGILASNNGGTGNGFAKFTGPASSEKTFTLPNSSAIILTSAAVVTGAQGGTGSAYFSIAGPTSARTYTFPDANATVLTSNAIVTASQGGTGSAYVEFTGPISSVKTFTLPNSSGTIPTVLTESATLDFAEAATLTSVDLTIAVSGAAVGNPVALGTPAAPNANTCYTAFVSATNVVTVRFNNYSVGAVNPDSATFKVTVFK
jgi:hypothetical protein